MMFRQPLGRNDGFCLITEAGFQQMAGLSAQLPVGRRSFRSCGMAGAALGMTVHKVAGTEISLRLA